jgi:hypothetical protein
MEKFDNFGELDGATIPFSYGIESRWTLRCDGKFINNGQIVSFQGAEVIACLALSGPLGEGTHRLD